MRSRTFRIVLLSALLGFGLQAAASAEKYTDEFRQTYQLGDDAEIIVSNVNGSVTVETWDRSDVELIAEKRVDASSAKAAEELFEKVKINVYESDGRLEIETDQPSGVSGLFDLIFGRARNASVRYSLRVPEAAQLDLRTVNGHVSTDGAGDQTLRSTNGKIAVEGARDAVSAYSTNGSIQVELVAVAAGPDVDLATTNGGITLYVPADISGRLEARTVNGSVKTDVPVSLQGSASRRRIEGDFNGDSSGRVGLRTTNGSIRIGRSGE